MLPVTCLRPPPSGRSTRRFATISTTNSDIVTRITKPVNMVNIGALSAQSDQPILFENIVEKPGFRLCDILVKNRRSQARALGVPEQDYLKTLAFRLRKPPRGIKKVKSGPVKEVVRTGSDVDWTDAADPAAQGQGLRAVCHGHEHHPDPETGFYNSCHAGTYAAGPRRGLISFVTPHSHIIMNKYRAMGIDKMPIAFVWGVPPAVEIMANFSGLHMDMWGEMEMVGTIMDRDFEMVPCETIDLDVPAQAEIVAEGVIHLGAEIRGRRRDLALDVSPAASRFRAGGRDHRAHHARRPADLPQSPDLPGHRPSAAAAALPRGDAL